MTSVMPATPAVSTPRCPVCGQHPISERTTSERGVSTGHYADAAGHIWSTRWLPGGGA